LNNLVSNRLDVFLKHTNTNLAKIKLLEQICFIFSAKIEIKIDKKLKKKCFNFFLKNFKKNIEKKKIKKKK